MPEKGWVTAGSGGFIGKNLCVTLENVDGIEVLRFDAERTEEDLKHLCQETDFVFHLAGVNRPPREEDHDTINRGLTETLLSILDELKRPIPVLLSSSTQALFDNPYGKSKHLAEDFVFDWGKKNKVPVYVYRFPNVFGKWCKPNYNSVVATWCHAIARGKPIRIDDPTKTLPLVYIDHVVTEMIKAMKGNPTLDCDGYGIVPVTFSVTLADIARRLSAFHDSRSTLNLPDCSDLFDKCLYATYLSYLPEDAFSYPLTTHSDHRGSFTEFLRTPERGQVSVNVSKPEITKGNHWHHTKSEKFLVVSGKGLICFRKLGEERIIEYKVSGEKLEVVDIPTGYTHSLVNTGDIDLVTIMWVNECFDPDNPDTYYLEVDRS